MSFVGFNEDNYTEIVERPDMHPEEDNEIEAFTIGGKTLTGTKFAKGHTWNTVKKFEYVKTRLREQVKVAMDKEDKMLSTKGKELKGVDNFDKQAILREYQELTKHYMVLDKVTNPNTQNDEEPGAIDLEIEGIDNKVKKQTWLIRANDTWKFWWDIIILLLAFFNSFTIPLSLASFDQLADSMAESQAYQIVNIGSAVFFVIDIVLQMNTSYYNQEGEEILDKKKIRTHYFFGMFPIDLISSVPIETFLGKHPLRVINILKIVRINRLTTIINKMNADEEKKSIFRILQLVVFLFLMMHFVGCFWNFIIHRDKLWIITLDFVHAGAYPKIYHFYEKDDAYKYICALYTALMFLGGNEMGPRTDTEMIVCPIILIFLAIFNAWLFGDMAVLSEMSGRKQAKFQAQIDIANTAMKQMDLPSTL
jgi:hypothetical protein